MRSLANVKSLIICAVPGQEGCHLEPQTTGPGIVMEMQKESRSQLSSSSRTTRYVFTSNDKRIQKTIA